jgi:hypothetical protein
MNGFRVGETFRSDRVVVETLPSPVGVSKAGIFAANTKLLFFLFILTLPLVNPWVRGDGVGYYAYVRSLLIDHDLRFENDYLEANQSFVMSRVDAQGHLLPHLYTKTGYVENHFAVGPAILWAPSILVTHGAVLLADRLGAHIPANGYSHPYMLAMAATTAGYGFLSLCLAFWIAQKYFEPQWAFFATVGIWLASSLPVYMYFNPSWSHAQSAFAVGLFIWYWERTRLRRTIGQWAMLGLIAGLMCNMYYPNAILLAFPGLESIYLLRAAVKDPSDFKRPLRQLALCSAVFGAVLVVALLPTLITRQIIYGSPFETGYPGIATWNWTSPRLLSVLFSSNHGMFSWTPVLLLAVVGFPFLLKRDILLGAGALVTFFTYYYFIASYPDWHGLSSFGNRFFVSLTPLFILGLAALLSEFSRWVGKATRAAAWAGAVLVLLVLWNFGFIFQWGTHLVPARGNISWSRMVHSQFVDVPEQLTNSLQSYFLHRGELMQHIEQQDIEQQKREGRRGK